MLGDTNALVVRIIPLIYRETKKNKIAKAASTAPARIQSTRLASRRASSPPVAFSPPAGRFATAHGVAGSWCLPQIPQYAIFNLLGLGLQHPICPYAPCQGFFQCLTVRVQRTKQRSCLGPLERGVRHSQSTIHSTTPHGSADKRTKPIVQSRTRPARPIGIQRSGFARLMRINTGTTPSKATIRIDTPISIGSPLLQNV